MIKRILIPVDGSDYSQKAVEIATELADKYTADLSLLYVMDHHGSTRTPKGLEEYSQAEHLHISEHDFLQAAADHILNAAERIILKSRASRPDKATLIGSPGQEIAKYANEHNTDLIVMGSRGLSDLTGLLLGSVSHKVSHLAKCSCLLVK